MLDRSRTVVAIGMIVVLPLATVALLEFLSSCGGVSAQDHVKNVGEGTEEQAEFTDCRLQGRAAKADGGGEIGYLVAYNACADKIDAKHGLDSGVK